MSEETTSLGVVGEYNLQFSGKVNGDLVVARGSSKEDLKNTIRGLADESDGESAWSLWNDFKVAAVAKGIFTGDATGDGGKSSGAKATPTSGDTPMCKHGAMKDLSDKGYKSTHYCSSNDRDNQCKPVNLR